MPSCPPEPSVPRIMPLIWDDPPGSDPPELQIDTCLDMAYRLRPCFGPCGLPKHLAFRFLRGLSAPPVHAPDTASLLSHLELEDPAAQALANAADAQAREVGDGAALVVLLGASLLEQAQGLLELGLTRQEVEDGYRLACSRALEALDGEGGEEREPAASPAALGDPRDEREVSGVLRGLLCTRVPEMADMLAEAVARCCAQSWTTKDGVMTFDPECIQVVKNIAGGPPNQTSEVQNCPQEESEEENKGEKMDENLKSVTKVRHQLKGETEEGTETEEGEAGEEGDWEVCDIDDIDDIDDKPKRYQESNSGGVYAGAMEGEDREQQLVDQFLSDYVDQRHTARVPRNREHGRYEGNYPELVPDEDWEILSLALDEIRLDGEVEGVGADAGLGRWREREEDKAQGDRQERERRQETRVGGRALRRSKTACKRLFRGLIRLGKKYLAPRSRGAEVKKHGRVRKLHRLMGKLRRPSVKYGKELQANNTHVTKHHPQPAKPFQASIACQDIPDQHSQSVSITLHSPDPVLLDSCESAIHACLRVYSSMQSDPRLVSGAGVVEAALSVQLCEYGLTLPGLEQMAVHSFAQALLAPARALGENQGTPADLAVTRMHEALRRRGKAEGPHERTGEGGVLEPLVCKTSALKKATKAVLSVMSDLQSKSPGGRGAAMKSPEPRHQSLQQP